MNDKRRLKWIERAHQRRKEKKSYKTIIRLVSNSHSQPVLPGYHALPTYVICYTENIIFAKTLYALRLNSLSTCAGKCLKSCDRFFHVLYIVKCNKTHLILIIIQLRMEWNAFQFYEFPQTQSECTWLAGCHFTFPPLPSTLPCKLVTIR